MKFAIWDNFQPREGVSPTQHFEEHLREVEIAEECGFHHYWFLEHHLSPRSPLPSPSILIGLALARTSRIRIGNMVNILPFRNPIIMAEEIAMLDTISGGRVDTGVGRGLKPTEFDTFCLDQNNSREMLNESLEIMTRIWKDENFAFEGKHFSVNKTTPMAPSVVQKPYPPIFISAQSEESIRWAAENDIHFGQIDAPVDECRRDCDLYREIQIASGHKPTPAPVPDARDFHRPHQRRGATARAEVPQGILGAMGPIHPVYRRGPDARFLRHLAQAGSRTIRKIL